VSGDSDVPFFASIWGSVDVADSTIQRTIVSSFQTGTSIPTEEIFSTPKGAGTLGLPLVWLASIALL
jgi:hypothetical protein